MSQYLLDSCSIPNIGYSPFHTQIFSIDSPVSQSRYSIPMQQGEVFSSKHISSHFSCVCDTLVVTHLFIACRVWWMPALPVFYHIVSCQLWSSCNDLVLFLKSHQLHSHLGAFELTTTSARIIYLPNMHNLNTRSIVALSKIDFDRIQNTLPQNSASRHFGMLNLLK